MCSRGVSYRIRWKGCIQEPLEGIMFFVWFVCFVVSAFEKCHQENPCETKIRKHAVGSTLRGSFLLRVISCELVVAVSDAEN